MLSLVEVCFRCCSVVAVLSWSLQTCCLNSNSLLAEKGWIVIEGNDGTACYSTGCGGRSYRYTVPITESVNARDVCSDEKRFS
jgi:hypothetical protein